MIKINAILISTNHSTLNLFRVNPAHSENYNATSMTMLEYSKMILEKVSFEPQIFKKELRKALRQSTQEEFKHLMAWCREKFSKKAMLQNETSIL